MPLNVINPERIEQYLGNLCDIEAASDEVKAHVLTALTKAVSNDHSNMAEVRRLPADAPKWLAKKWPEGGPYYEFMPPFSDDQLAMFGHITHWLRAAVANQEPWLTNHVDERGRPHRLLQIKSFDDAMRMANHDMRIATERLANQMTNYVGEEETVAKFTADGEMLLPGDEGFDELVPAYRMARLRTPEELDYESAEMKHCIGLGGDYDEQVVSGERVFYSLRDIMNFPHATLEVDTQKHSLNECKGKQNIPPDEGYMPYVQQFVKYHRYRLNEAISHTGLICKGSEYYDVLNLPKDFRWDRSLNYTYKTGVLEPSKAMLVKHLPDGLQIQGDLVLHEAPIIKLGKGTCADNLDIKGTPLTHLPEHLNLEYSLHLLGTNVTHIGDHTRVGMSLDATDSKLEHVGEHVRVTGNFSAINAPLTSLGEHLNVGLNCAFSNTTALQRIPNHTTIGQSLHLQGSAVTELGEHVTIGGHLDLHGTKVRTLGSHLKVGGRLDLYDTQVEALPDHVEVSNLLLNESEVKSIGDHLLVHGHLPLSYTKVQRIGSHAHINSHLLLNDSNVTHIGKHLHVGGNMDAFDTKLTKLPDHLYVGGDLSLGEGINELPKGLHVKGNLLLNRSGVTKIPDDAIIEGKVIDDIRRPSPLVRGVQPQHSRQGPHQGAQL